MLSDYIIHGVRLRLEAEGDLAERFSSGLLPEASRQSFAEADCHFHLRTQNGLLSLEQDGLSLIQHQDAAVVAQILRARLHEQIAARAKVLLAIRGGAVLWRNQAWIFPASPLSGTTRLVEELVALGATRYSDQMVMLDPSLRVVPYQGDPKAALQAQAAPVGTIARVPFRGGSSLELQREACSQAALHVLSFCRFRQDQAAQVMQTVSKLCLNAICLQGSRAEAAACARTLLEEYF